MMIRCSPVESTFICSVAVPTQPAGKLLLFDIKTKKLEVSFMVYAGWVLYVVFVLLGWCCTLCLCSISLLNSDAFLSNHKYHSCGSLVVAALVL